ncbi:MAG: hypothetical protein ABIH41_04090 [Nanoarchaeota archaeon]
MGKAEDLLREFEALANRAVKDRPTEEQTIGAHIAHLHAELSAEHKRLAVIQKAHDSLPKILSIIHDIDSLFERGGKEVRAWEEKFRDPKHFMWHGDTPYDEIYKDIMPKIDKKIAELQSTLAEIQTMIDGLPPAEHTSPEIQYVVRILDYLHGRSFGDQQWKTWHYAFVKFWFGQQS